MQTCVCVLACSSCIWPRFCLLHVALCTPNDSTFILIVKKSKIRKHKTCITTKTCQVQYIQCACINIKVNPKLHSTPKLPFYTSSVDYVFVILVGYMKF